MDHTQTRTLVIRPATPEDAARVAPLSTQLGYAASETEMEYRIHRTRRDHEQALFVAEADGVVVGWVQDGVLALECHSKRRTSFLRKTRLQGCQNPNSVPQNPIV